MTVVSPSDVDSANQKDGTQVRQPRPLIVPVLGGAAAGMSVDIALFPLDTLKTRLQSQHGFRKSGGFSGIYRGVGPTGLISPVSAGIFIGTYETVKNLLTDKTDEKFYPFVHMFGASVAEVISCVAKVPMEIVKQRRQASIKNLSSINIAILAVKNEGFFGLYRGFGSTVLRDVPFSIIEFPIWEWLKKEWRYKVKRELTAIEVSACGAIAGAVAAAVTTPLDVVKTQIMLAERDINSSSSPGIFSQMRIIYQQHGITKLFAGFTPRISMIMVGGAIFFGVYDKCCKIIEHNFIIT